MQLVAFRCSNTNTVFCEVFLWHFAVPVPWGKEELFPQERSVGRARSKPNLSEEHQNKVWSRSSCRAGRGVPILVFFRGRRVSGGSQETWQSAAVTALPREQPQLATVCSVPGNCHGMGTWLDSQPSSLPSPHLSLPSPSLSSIPSLQLAAQGVSIPSGNLVTAPLSPSRACGERQNIPVPLVPCSNKCQLL